MPFKSYKEESKSNWGINSQEDLTIQQVQMGAILRIADAAEIMATNYIRLQNDNEYYKRRHKEQLKEIERLNRSRNALSGHLKRLKKQLNHV